MSFIHVLDEITINQIAAGEVVERPSAVVKELLENAMDAGATAITAEIKEGGLSFIRITDNGLGIAKEDIPLAFLRHATSKIRTAEDLLSVTSLGFRGEALSSIAAVAQVELITKTPTALNGFRYLIEGGEEKSLEEIGSPGGTTIIIRNIFYNTPARRKFLKSATTEAGYISDLMERLIVSHPEVSFKFIVNNQVKLQSSGNSNTKDILYHIYGRDISKELLSIEYISEDIKVSGYIGKPIITRGNRNFENYFINGRYIKSNIIMKAIEEAYKPFLMQHKYPFTSLYFEINPSLIDVNVHPQKMEIRLKNGDEIYQLIYQLIRNTLSGKEMIPKVLLTHQQESKSEFTHSPEPFEQNRRKQFEGLGDKVVEDKVLGNKVVGYEVVGYEVKGNDVKGNDVKGNDVKGNEDLSQNSRQTQRPYTYGKGYDQPYHKVAEHNTDYITATEPLINTSSKVMESISGLAKLNLINSTAVIDTNSILSTAVADTNVNISITKDTGTNNSTTIDRNNANINISESNNNTNNANNTSNFDLNNYETNMSDPSNRKSIIIDTNNSETNRTDPRNGEINKIDTNNCGSDKSATNYMDANKPNPDDTDGKLIADQNSSQPIQELYVQPIITTAQQLNLFEGDSSVDASQAPFLSKKAFEEHRIIGQVFSTYWLVEYKRELYIIDQHAAHEKVLYEKIMTAAKDKTFESQQLLPPIVLTLTLKEQEILQKHEKVLESLGYEFEYFGGKEYSVRAVPADLYSISEKELLLEFIDAIAEDLPGNTSDSNAILERVASLSCKAAVKANHNFSYVEASALIKELLTLENPYHCPHGRPVIISMSQYELERKFKRIL